eukprot:NODE_14769_length_1087_cov_8.384375.p1 GENE.NODE_14769_length_1087_cov_8.384375~~NODE_14769_length_1087_cov_8.384375.p1  ORF type:complete len:316 (-),score=86.29 NODE_14769_length_1087_cov_8.384375:138-1001(-)
MRCLDVAVLSAQEAGNLMLECFARNDALSLLEEKSNPVDLVTKYDREVEELVLGRLRAAFPDFAVVAEESANDAEFTDAPTWVVDPIDGTTNFAHRQHECCVLIGLTIGRRPVLGVCFIPKLDEMYTAVRGRGAYMNGRRIHASPCTLLNKALVNTHFPSYDRAPQVSERLFQLLKDFLTHPVSGIRSGGSAGVDMIRVANGTLDAYFEIGIYIWDICAGVVIVEEAGGVCIDTLGGGLDLMKRRVLATSTPQLAEQITGYMRKHQFSSLNALDYKPPEADESGTTE